MGGDTGGGGTPAAPAACHTGGREHRPADDPDPGQRHRLCRGTKFPVSRTLVGTIVYRLEEDDRLVIFDPEGTQLIEYPWPAPGTKYVGNGQARGPRGPRKSPGLSEMS